MTRSTALDRMIIATVGLVALIAGGYGMARNLGAFGVRQGDGVLVDASLRRSVVDHAGWVAAAATFVALVVAWLGWRWLRRQLLGPSPPLRRVGVADAAGGHTAVEARALVEAVVRDLEADPQVTAAQARVVGHQQAPELELAVELTAAADLRAVRRHVEDHVLPRAKAALGRDELIARLRLQLGDPGHTRPARATSYRAT